MHNDKLFEFIKEKFEKDGGCNGCNSRYCDGSFEWMSACQKFNEYFKKETYQSVSDEDKKLLDKIYEEWNKI